jgi:hypothetical protein
MTVKIVVPTKGSFDCMFPGKCIVEVLRLEKSLERVLNTFYYCKEKHSVESPTMFKRRLQMGAVQKRYFLQTN